MGDRVHPYVVEGAPIHYPSPFEAHANQHVHTPPTIPHKEQEQRLLRSNDQDGLNEAAAAHQYPRRTTRRRHRRCMRCCCCIAAFLATFVVLLGILVLVLFLVLHPKLPKYTITQATITQFSISNVSTTPTATQAEEGTLFLNAEAQFLVSMRNPNKRIGIDYRSVTGALIYDGVEIGQGSIPPFYQGHKNTTHVELPMVGRDIKLLPSLGTTLKESLQNDDSLTLHARATTRVRIKIGHWKSHTSKVRVKCRIQISNPTRGNVRLLNDSCKFKLLRLRL